PPAGYVFQAPPIVLPQEIDWEPGQPIPPGYAPASRARTGLVIGGAVTFGVVYGLNVLAASMALSYGGDDFAPLLVPVAGPLLLMAFGEGVDGEAAGFLALDACAQLAGAIMLVGGLAAQKPILRYRGTIGGVRVEPTP